MTVLNAPPLPRAQVLPLPDRGELFVRHGESGTATPVVLIHGWQATADLNFFPLYAALSDHRPFIAADLRGHGRSLYPEDPFTLEDAADDVAAMLDAIGWTKVVVLGYSLGTAVGQLLADRRPDLVAGLVLAAGEIDSATRPHEKLYNRIGGWLSTLQRTTRGRGTAHRIVTKSARENRSLEALRGWLVTEMERGHSASLRAAGRALARFDGRAVAERAQVPAAVVLTTRDRLVRPPRQERMAKHWRAEVVRLDADHDAPLARPDAFVEACVRAMELVESKVPA